jgi:hypothetical protein
MPDSDPADVNVNIRKPGAMTIWQAAGTLGVGTVLVLLIVPRIMTSGEKTTDFLQGKFITTLETNAANQTALVLKIDKLVDATDETNNILRPMVGKLEKFATAVNDQVEAVEADRAEDGQ